MTTRRSFFKTAGLGATAVAGLAAGGCSTLPEVPGKKETDTFRLGIAGYTFVKFNIDETLEMMKKVDAHYLCIKNFHLPETCTAGEAAAFHKKCAEYGVTGYGCGPLYMDSHEAAEKAFEYVKRVGVKTLVGVPYKKVGKKRVEDQELLEYINTLVQKYDIKYAIHNHGPDMPELFPNAESAIKRIAHMDKRMGLCLDIGHQFRDGRCPVQAIMDYSERIHDMHIKNVSADTKKGRTIEMPRGKIDITAVVKALRKVKYSGVCSLEYEKDMSDPITGIAESIGYFKGIMDATR
ncbi:MAG: sugar phosphate isomerase/epimerase [Kiritimatiellia bacterium]